MRLRVAVLTLSDKGARGERDDTSGAAVRELLEGIGAEVVRYAIAPDEREIIAARLREWADVGDIDLLVTTGGTGLATRDVTPEATRAILDYEVPGISEAMRAAGLRSTPLAMLSRGVSGVRKRCLIINLPGSERGVRESLAAVLAVLPHAVQTMQDAGGDHGAA